MRCCRALPECGQACPIVATVVQFQCQRTPPAALGPGRRGASHPPARRRPGQPEVTSQAAQEGSRQGGLPHPDPGASIPNKLGTVSHKVCSRGWRRSTGREVDSDGRPLADLTGEVNRPAVFFNHFVRQR